MYRIFVKGAVQGVGFRPTVYRIASKLDINGYVRNVGSGEVEIVVDKNAEEFVNLITKNAPVLARIEKVVVEEADITLDRHGFHIIESSESTSNEDLSLPPPDMATCPQCVSELKRREDRRYGFAFISCTDCGARFTVLRKLPFDRNNTSFSEFPLCEECENEYRDMDNRRYYAQTIACKECGPNYQLLMKGRKITGVNGIRKAAEMLDEGKLIAIKGLGGYHIACITDDDVVARLRKLLKRPQQPFAVMARDVECAKKIAFMNDMEEEALQSPQRPILILKKRNKDDLQEVAPGLNTVGVMLPYAPVHHLLFQYMKSELIVMTSANMPGEPMHTDERITHEIKLDGYLTHNLKIENRCDDSVMKIVANRKMFIRRSRGFVPQPINIEARADAVACGAELYNAFCVVKNGNAFMSQYIGDTSKFKTYNEFFKKSLEFFTALLKPEVKAVICDLHPLYNTSNFARELSSKLNARLFQIQHHFAHGLSVMAERKLSRAIAIVCDGTGYGFDGKAWGGEVLLIDFDKLRFQRVGHIKEFALIGYDLAARYPLRVLYSLLYPDVPPEFIEEYACYMKNSEIFNLFEKQMRSKAGIAYSTSAGRVMDAVSALLKICFERTYEGEPAMKLESVAERRQLDIKPKIEVVRENSKFSHVYMHDGFKASACRSHVLEVSPFVHELFEKFIHAHEEKSKLAYEAIAYLADGLSEIALKYARKYDMPVVLSGGVMANSHFVERAVTIFKEHEIDVFLNEKVACGDNGIALGQAYLARCIGDGKNG